MIARKTLRTVCLGTLLVAAVGCSSMNRRVSRGSSTSDATMPATVNAAAEANASHVAEIVFAKDSAELSQEAREQLSSIADAARLSRKIDDVKILAWADEEYPSVRTHKLSKAERKLADRRAKSIKDFLASNFNVRGADTINMAARPNQLQKMFKTDNARLKSAMETAGIRDTDSLNKTRAAKASHAVVMFITE